MKTPQSFILDGIWGRCRRWRTLEAKIATHVGPCNIHSYDNSGRTSLEKLGHELGLLLNEIDRPIHLIGYSMGSLVIREAIRQNPSLPLVNAAFLHSPHAGSLAAWMRPDLIACREMRPESPFLKRMNAAKWEYRTLVTWTSADLVVFPGWSARWSKASHVVQSAIPVHAWPIVSRGIHSAVIDFLTMEKNSPSYRVIPT